MHAQQIVETKTSEYVPGKDAEEGRKNPDGGYYIYKVTAVWKDEKGQDVRGAEVSTGARTGKEACDNYLAGLKEHATQPFKLHVKNNYGGIVIYTVRPYTTTAYSLSLEG